MQGNHLAVNRECATDTEQSLAEKLRRDGLVADAVGGKFLFIYIDIQLLMLVAERLDIAHRRHTAQPSLEHVHIAVHLAVGLVARVQRHQQRRGIAKIVHHHQRQYTGRELALKVLQPVAYL